MAMKADVTISAGVRDGKTVLRDSRFTPPFKVADITEDRQSGWLHLMLMSSSPGILDGDEYRIRVSVGDSGRLRLHTQSYQRLFTMRAGGGAVQSMEVRVGAGSALCYVPHPVVPHKDAVFSGCNRIYLEAGSQLVWGEALTCGRKLNGEVFAYSRYHSISDIYQAGRLVLRENILQEPGRMNVRGIGHMEGFTHQASVLLAGEGMGYAETQIREYMAREEGMSYGISRGPSGVLVLRMLGHGAEQLYACLKAAAGFVCTGKTPLYAG